MYIAVIPLFIPSTRNLFFLLQSMFNRTRVLSGVAGLPLTILSNRNHLCVLHDAFGWARVMFAVTDAHWNISSTSNYIFLIYGTFERAIITIGVHRPILDDDDFFMLTFPSPRNHLLLLNRHFSFLHPAGSFFFSAIL